MHESSLARQLLAVVLEHASAHGAGAVRVVRGFVAETEALAPEAIAFHFAAHARGTPAEHARLELDVRHVRATCTACSTTYLPEHHVLSCPACGATDAELEGDVGVGIDTLEVD